jgi:surface protein
MATAFAVFCATDGSLTFYNRDTVPAVGDAFEGKVASNVYTGFENKAYDYQAVPWYNKITGITGVYFMDEFAAIKPVSTSYWFDAATNMTLCNLKNLDTSNVTDMNNMFRECTSLTTADLSGLDTSNVTSMAAMFYMCPSLTTVDLSGLDTSNVKDMNNMFRGCPSLTTVDLSGLDTSNVNNMSLMFYMCPSLTTVDLSGLDTSNVTSMNDMFRDCTALTTIYVSEHLSTHSVTNSTNMFLSCTSLVGAVPYDSTKTDKTMANYETGYFTYKFYCRYTEDRFVLDGAELNNIANAIREKTGKTEAIVTSDMPSAILEIDTTPEDALFLDNRHESIKIYGSANWKSITYGNGRFVAVASYSTKAAYSDDGITWTETTLPSSVNWYSVTYGNGRFVAVASNSTASAYSDDGITWNAATLPSSTNWYSVTCGNGRFVAVANTSDKTAYSDDGINWIEVTMPSSAIWYSVTYGNGRFVAVASNSTKAAYSDDGITWNAATLSSSASWQSVTYGNGRFVVVAQNSTKAAYSDDGINWTETTLPSSAYWQSVTYGNGRFVAAAYNSTKVAYSTDGVTWYDYYDGENMAIFNIDDEDVTEASIDATGFLDVELSTQDRLIAHIVSALEGKTGATGSSSVTVGEVTKSASDTSITIADIIGKDNVALMFMDTSSCPANQMEDAGIINVIIQGASHYYNTHYYDGSIAYGNDGFIVYDKTTGRISLSGAYNETFIAGKYMYVTW